MEKLSALLFPDELSRQGNGQTNVAADARRNLDGCLAKRKVTGPTAGGRTCSARRLAKC